MTEKIEKSGVRLTLENREALHVQGVNDVISFDENGAVLQTGDGILIVDGASLHVKAFDVECGSVRVEGRINGLLFSDASGSKGRKRLFK